MTRADPPAGGIRIELGALGAPRTRRAVRLLVFWGLLLLGGCSADGRWTKPDLTPGQFDHDRDECWREATSVRVIQGYGTAREQQIDANVFRACMMARGYRVTSPPK